VNEVLAAAMESFEEVDWWKKSLQDLVPLEIDFQEL
jgi:hypothetical protein